MPHNAQIAEKAPQKNPKCPPRAIVNHPPSLADLIVTNLATTMPQNAPQIHAFAQETSPTTLTSRFHTHVQSRPVDPPRPS